MARGSPLRRLNVLGYTVITIVFAGSGCSLTSAPSHTKGSAPTPPATATSLPPPAPPYCGVITGRHRYLASPPARNAVLLLGTGPRGVVLGAQANGGICQVLPIAQQFVRRGYHVVVFDWSIDNTNYAADMTRATRALLADGARRVVLGGFSRGALVALGAAPEPGPRIVGVISISGGPSPSEGFPTIRSLAAFRGRYCWSAAKTTLSSHPEPVRLSGRPPRTQHSAHGARQRTRAPVARRALLAPHQHRHRRIPRQAAVN
jgi:pimeloyl-ACP methyl ester carboxylesterase